MVDDLLTMAELIDMVADMRTRDMEAIRAFAKFVPSLRPMNTTVSGSTVKQQRRLRKSLTDGLMTSMTKMSRTSIFLTDTTVFHERKE